MEKQGRSLSGMEIIGSPDTEASDKRKAKQISGKAYPKKSCLNRNMLPDPMYLVGKRVEHTFMVQVGESQRRKKLIYTGTVSRIVRKSNDPLYTRYEIIYDVDNIPGDNEDDSEDEDINNVFQYELMTDYVNGDLMVVGELVTE